MTLTLTLTLTLSLTLNPHQVQHFIAPRPGIPSISSANAVRILVLEPNAAGVLEAQLPTETEGGSLAVEQVRPPTRCELDAPRLQPDAHRLLTRCTQAVPRL